MVLQILLVDDNRDTLHIYTKALKRALSKVDKQSLVGGYDSIEVENSDSVPGAIEQLNSRRVDLLIVDLKIPGQSGDPLGGFEVISEALSLDALRPVIVITGYGNVELVRRTLTQGAFDFIEKSSTVQADLVGAVLRAMDHRNERMLRAGNPFTPMTGLEPTRFGGRTDELAFFDERLNRALHTKFCDHFLVLGDWGIGKSTLLREYKKLTQNRGHVACVVPLEPLDEGASAFEAARSIVEGILRDLPYPVAQLRKLLSFFESAGISVLGTGLQFKRNTSKEELSTQAFVHDTLLKIWEEVEDRSQGPLVILLDDLDNFHPASMIVMTLRQTLAMESFRKAKILLGISSTTGNWMEITSMDRHHPIARYFTSHAELGPLNAEEVRETIIKSLSMTGVSFSPDVVSRVIEYTGGHPFEMQVLCHCLFSCQLSKCVTMDSWDKALLAALTNLGSSVFEHWLTAASAEEEQVLGILSRAGHEMSAKDVEEAARTTGATPINQGANKHLRELAGRKLVVRTSQGSYCIRDKMFSAYIRARNDAKLP